MSQLRTDVRIIQQKQMRRRHWSRLFFIWFGVFIALFAIILAYFYFSLTPVRNSEGEIKNIVRQKTDITQQETFLISNRNDTYFSVIGKTKNGTEKVALIKNGSKYVETFKRSSGMSNEALNKLLNEKYKVKHIYSIAISKYKGTVVWEIAYLSKNNKLNYLTLDFKTGKVYREITGI